MPLPYAPPTRDLTCPHCQHGLMRVERRTVDRMASWFVPQRRYRCLSFNCQWEGTIRCGAGVPDTDTHPAQLQRDTSLAALESNQGTGVPASFVANITLAVVGIVAVVFFANSDWLLPLHEDDALSSSTHSSAAP